MSKSITNERKANAKQLQSDYTVIAEGLQSHPKELSN
jgi:hypothetical protein